MSDPGSSTDHAANGAGEPARVVKRGLWPFWPFRAAGRTTSAEPDAEVDDGGSYNTRPSLAQRLVNFGSKRVGDAMIPRANIVAVEIETSLEDLLRIFAEAQHSRLPVYRGELDDPQGMVHIRDIVSLIASRDVTAADRAAIQPLATLMKPLLYVPSSMTARELLERMQSSRLHMALVIDEFGGTDGLVTIEDLIEEIVGDIRDEHDTDEEFGLVSVGDGRWDADARSPLELVRSTTGIEFDLDDHEADTIGGLVASLIGRMPHRGEIVPHPNGATIEVVEADARRVRRVQIRRPRGAQARTDTALAKVAE